MAVRRMAVFGRRDNKAVHGALRMAGGMETVGLGVVKRRIRLNLIQVRHINEGRFLRVWQDWTAFSVVAIGNANDETVVWTMGLCHLIL
jgi:hypothetical protein